MASVIKGTMPYPPSVNRYWDTTFSKRKSPITGKKIKIVERVEAVKAYMYEAYFMIKQQRLPKLESKSLRLELMVFPPDKKQRDIDNVCKAVLDALQHAHVYDNDFYIDELFIKRKEVRKGGEIEFRLSALT